MSGLGWVAFVVAAGAGAVARYLIDNGVTARMGDHLPWGTFVVNATGSLVAGFLAGLALYQGLSTTPRVILLTGFCGAYTTFSTFMFETVALAEEGAIIQAVLNLSLTVVTCAVAAAGGLALASL